MLFRSVTDPRYIKDIFEWTKVSKFSESIDLRFVIINSLITNPNSKDVLAIYLQNSNEDDLLKSVFAKSIPQNSPLNSAIVKKMASRDLPNSFLKIRNELFAMANVRVNLLIKGDKDKSLKDFAEINFKKLSEFKNSLLEDSRDMSFFKETMRSFFLDVDAYYFSLKANDPLKIKFKEMYQTLLVLEKS